jgi:hypothetical protein
MSEPTIDPPDAVTTAPAEEEILAAVQWLKEHSFNEYPAVMTVVRAMDEARAKAQSVLPLPIIKTPTPFWEIPTKDTDQEEIIVELVSFMCDLRTRLELGASSRETLDTFVCTSSTFRDLKMMLKKHSDYLPF